MRRAIWMALAFMGTAPLVALAQQTGGGQATQPPAASPTGTSSIERGQDITGVETPGAAGQQSAGSIGTTTGEPATGGAGMQGDGGAGMQGDGGTGGAGGQTGQSLNGVPLQRPGQGGQELTGSTTGTGGLGGTTGPTYRGTTQETPSTGGAGAGAGATTGQGGGAGGGQAAGQQALMSSDAMVRELATLRERVARLERQVTDLGRGTGGGGAGGTGGAGGAGTANVRAQGPVTVATAVFDGRVVDVQPKHIDIVDTSDGTFYRLTIDRQTRAFDGPELNRIPVGRISEGTQVRTSFALSSSGVEHARNIVTQPVQQRQSGQQGTPQGQPRETPQGQTPSQ